VISLFNSNPRNAFVIQQYSTYQSASRWKIIGHFYFTKRRPQNKPHDSGTSMTYGSPRGTEWYLVLGL